MSAPRWTDPSSPGAVEECFLSSVPPPTAPTVSGRSNSTVRNRGETKAPPQTSSRVRTDNPLTPSTLLRLWEKVSPVRDSLPFLKIQVNNS